MTKMKISFLDNPIHQKMGVNIYLDNNLLGKIYTNEEMEFNVLPGNHEIYAKFLFIKTHPIRFKTVKENRNFEILNVPLGKEFLKECVVEHHTPITMRQRIA